MNNTFSARFVFTNRVGLWPANTPESAKEFFPGVAFPKDPKVMDQYFRNQYVEFNAASNTERESTALAVLLEEVYKQHGAKAILHTHSSSHSRGLLVPRKTDKLAGSNRLGAERRSSFPGKVNCRRPYRAPMVCGSPPGLKFLWRNFSSSPSIRSC